MFKHLMNDTVEWKSVQNSDEYDLPIFNQIRTIKCKFEFAQNSVQNDGSCTRLLPARMFCHEPDIAVGDIISRKNNNYKVIQVNNYNDFDGNFMLSEVFLS